MKKAAAAVFLIIEKGSCYSMCLFFSFIDKANEQKLVQGRAKNKH